MYCFSYSIFDVSIIIQEDWLSVCILYLLYVNCDGWLNCWQDAQSDQQYIALVVTVGIILSYAIITCLITRYIWFICSMRFTSGRSAHLYHVLTFKTTIRTAQIQLLSQSIHTRTYTPIQVSPNICDIYRHASRVKHYRFCIYSSYSFNLTPVYVLRMNGQFA